MTENGGPTGTTGTAGGGGLGPGSGCVDNVDAGSDRQLTDGRKREGMKGCDPQPSPVSGRGIERLPLNIGWETGGVDEETEAGERQGQEEEEEEENVHDGKQHLRDEVNPYLDGGLRPSGVRGRSREEVACTREAFEFV